MATVQPSLLRNCLVVKWYDIIGEQTIADAILDRIVHDAHRVELIGESLRKKYGMKKEMNLISMQ